MPFVFRDSLFSWLSVRILLPFFLYRFLVWTRQILNFFTDLCKQNVPWWSKKYAGQDFCFLVFLSGVFSLKSFIILVIQISALLHQYDHLLSLLLYWYDNFQTNAHKNAQKRATFFTIVVMLTMIEHRPWLSFCWRSLFKENNW